MIDNHKVVSHEEWLAARLELLEAEKELTRCSDELARRNAEAHEGLSAFALEDGVVYHTYSSTCAASRRSTSPISSWTAFPAAATKTRCRTPGLGSVAGTNTAPLACRAVPPPRACRDPQPRGHIENGTNDQGHSTKGEKDDDHT